MPQEQAPLDTDSNQNSPNEQLPELFALLSRDKYTLQKTVDNILTLWVTANTLQPTLSL